MSRRPLHRLLAFALVLAMTAGTAAPAWAVSVVVVPGHHFAVAATAAGVECDGCGGDHGAATVAHADCVICLGLAVPVDLAEAHRKLPAGFVVRCGAFGTGLSPDREPHPPRSPSRRI